MELGGGEPRPSKRTKPTTDEALPLDIRRLARAGGLTPGRHVVSWPVGLGAPPTIAYWIADHGARLTLAYTLAPILGAVAESVEETVPIVTTPGQFGGARPWFSCPGCQRRIAILHGFADRFRCRACHGLVYASTREDSTHRLLRKAERLRTELGGPPGMGRVPPRPQGISQARYERTLQQIAKLEGAYISACLRKLTSQPPRSISKRSRP